MNLDMFKSSDEEDKRVLYPVQDTYDVIDVNVHLPKGVYIIGYGLIIIGGLFIFAYFIVGYHAPQEHIPQIVNHCRGVLL